MSVWLLLLLSAHASRAAQPKDGDKAVVSEDITIKGKGSKGPPLDVPPPAADGKVLDEVVRSLDLYRAEHKSPPPKLKVSGGSSRLARPFPEPPYLVFNPRSFPNPYDRWTFEVLADGVVAYKTEGAGSPAPKLEWDGTESTGKTLARVGQAYSFRFTGARGKDEYSVTSEPVELASVVFREALGDTHLEASNAALFARGKPELLESALPYLNEMARRMRRFDPKEQPYRILLYQRNPSSKLARKRADSLVKFFSRALVISPSRISAELKPVGERGDCAAVVVPPEKGPALRVEP